MDYSEILKRKELMHDILSTQDQKTIALLQATGLFNIISKLDFHNGVILAYDHDEDVRLKIVVDRIKTPYLDQDLMVAYECDGCLTLIWKDEVPELFSEGQSVAATYPEDPFPYEHIDHWHITHSVTGRVIEHKALVSTMNQSTGFEFSLN